MQRDLNNLQRFVRRKPGKLALARRSRRSVGLGETRKTRVAAIVLRKVELDYSLRATLRATTKKRALQRRVHHVTPFDSSATYTTTYNATALGCKLLEEKVHAAKQPGHVVRIHLHGNLMFVFLYVQLHAYNSLCRSLFAVITLFSNEN